MICLVYEIIFETLFMTLFVVSYSADTLGILIRAYSGMTHKHLTYCHHLSAFTLFIHMSVQYYSLGPLYIRLMALFRF